MTLKQQTGSNKHILSKNLKWNLKTKYRVPNWMGHSGLRRFVLVSRFGTFIYPVFQGNALDFFRKTNYLM